VSGGVPPFSKRISLARIFCESLAATIEDTVFCNPSASYEDVIDSVAMRFGFYRDELNEKYTRCREVYKGAVAKYASW
jgi:hypothetical protein